MQVGFKDIDAVIADCFNARLCEDVFPVQKYLHAGVQWPDAPSETPGGREPTDEELRAYEVHKKRQDAHSGWTAFTFFLPAIAGTAAAWSQGLWTGLASAAGIIAIGSLQMKRASSHDKLRRAVSVEELRAALPLLDLNRLERLYGDTMLLLVEAGPNLRDKDGREILARMNELVARGREVDRQHELVERARSQQPVAEAERERTELLSRMNGVTDPFARENLQQSLAMCDERIRNAQDLDSAGQRLDTQAEAIYQTMAAVRSAIVRAMSAPSLDTADEIARVSQQVEEINIETRSVEQAVQEVVQLRAG